MKKLLACVDGSAYSSVCCEYAAWLAKKANLEIDGLYVSSLFEQESSMITDFAGALGIEPYQNLSANIKEFEKERARLIGEATHSILAKHGLGDRVNFHHITGTLVDAVLEFEEQGSDIVCIGKRGQSANNAKEHLGPMMERVVRASSKPVLVTSREFQPLDRLVFAYDGGVSCQAAAQWLAKQEWLADTAVTVITVHEERYQEKASKRLKEAESLLSGSVFTPELQLLTGIVENVIEDYINEHDANGLVMGAYGHSRVRELLIGSTTTDLIRRCKVPILLFR